MPYLQVVTDNINWPSTIWTALVAGIVTIWVWFTNKGIVLLTKWVDKRDSAKAANQEKIAEIERAKYEMARVDLQRLVDDTKADNKELKERMSRQEDRHSAKIDKYIEQYSVLNESNIKLNAQIASLNTQIVSLNAQIVSLQNEVSTLKEELRKEKEN